MIWLAACEGPAETDPATLEPRVEAELVDAAAWSPGDPTVWADPGASDAPDPIVCEDGGVFPEGSSLEVDTGLCNYAWQQQPLLADLRPGDVVEVVFWHSALLADEPAVGHLALFVGDSLVYERWVDIPADPYAYTEAVTLSFAAEEGDPVALHVHNHGANTWNLLRATRLASP